MISLFIWIGLILAWLLATAWVLARSARAVGSRRGRYSIGLLILVLIYVFDFALLGCTLRLQPAAPAPAWPVLLTVLQICGVYAIIRYGFALTSGRAFAPFGAFVGMILVQFGLALFVVRPYLTEAFVMPTASMAPTIEPGDRFMVNKIIRPRRLDLVAYWTQDTNRQVYCKRLVGLPGERLRFENGGLFVNDQPVRLPPLLAGNLHASPGALRTRETRYRDGQTIVLGADEYFLVGDNADLSIDSRMHGPTHANDLVGVADAMYWPPKRARIFR